MIAALTRFVKALRDEGIKASPAELLDATRAVEIVGLENRARFREALSATLAKSHDQRETFRRVFDRFFVPPHREGKGEKRGRAGVGGSGGSRRGRPGLERTPSSRTLPRKTDAESPRERTAKPPSHGEDRGGERVRRMLDATDRRGPDRVGRLRRAATTRVGEKAAASSRRGDAVDLDRVDLKGPLTVEDERDLARRVPRMIETLRLRSSRRLRPSSRGRLWSRRLFRDNLTHGGVPFVLPFRRAKPRRVRVTLLVDVSYSAARATGYFLWMAAEFLRLERRTRVLAFVDRPVDATREIDAWLRGRGDADAAVRGSRDGPRPARGRRRAPPGEGIRPAGRPFAEMLDSLRGLNLAAPSDYGRAFHALAGSRLRPRGRDTVLVILGDGRTNRFDPLSWALEELVSGCRAVLWLVPERRESWGTGDSALADYLPHADVVVEAWNLAGLADGLEALLRRL
jgi:uncharacterized protein with von Willebrand factor type A (vWA) domain